MASARSGSEPTAARTVGAFRHLSGDMEIWFFRTFGAARGCRAAANPWSTCVFGLHEPVSARTGASSAGRPGIPALLNPIATARRASPAPKVRKNPGPGPLPTRGSGPPGCSLRLGLGLRRAGLLQKAGAALAAQAVAVAADGDDVAVVQQPVEQGRGHLRVAGHLEMPL